MKQRIFLFAAVLVLSACANEAPSMLASCLQYCTQLRACDKTGDVDDTALESCKSQCQLANDDPKIAIDSRKLECASETDCTAFQNCLNPKSDLPVSR